MSDNFPTPEQVKAISGPELVAAHNALNPGKPVHKFSSRDTGIRRVLAALEAATAEGQAADTTGESQAAPAGQEQQEAATAPQEPAPPQPGAGPEQSAPKRSRRRSGVRSFEPGGDRKPPRATSKRASCWNGCWSRKAWRPRKSRRCSSGSRAM